MTSINNDISKTIVIDDSNHTLQWLLIERRIVEVVFGLNWFFDEMLDNATLLINNHTKLVTANLLGVKRIPYYLPVIGQAFIMADTLAHTSMANVEMAESIFDIGNNIENARMRFENIITTQAGIESNDFTNSIVSMTSAFRTISEIGLPQQLIDTNDLIDRLNLFSDLIGQSKIKYSHKELPTDEPTDEPTDNPVVDIINRIEQTVVRQYTYINNKYNDFVSTIGEKYLNVAMGELRVEFPAKVVSIVRKLNNSLPSVQGGGGGEPMSVDSTELINRINKRLVDTLQ